MRLNTLKLSTPFFIETSLNSKFLDLWNLRHRWPAKFEGSLKLSTQPELKRYSMGFIVRNDAFDNFLLDLQELINIPYRAIEYLNKFKQEKNTVWVGCVETGNKIFYKIYIENLYTTGSEFTIGFDFIEDTIISEKKYFFNTEISKTRILKLFNNSKNEISDIVENIYNNTAVQKGILVKNSHRESYLLPCNFYAKQKTDFSYYQNYKSAFDFYNLNDLNHSIFSSFFPYFYYPSWIQIGSTDDQPFFSIYYRFKKEIQYEPSRI